MLTGEQNSPNWTTWDFWCISLLPYLDFSLSDQLGIGRGQVSYIWVVNHGQATKIIGVFAEFKGLHCPWFRQYWERELSE